jgi:hypothetical protein
MVSDVNSITLEALLYAFRNIWYRTQKNRECICTALYRNRWCAKHGNLSSHGQACLRTSEKGR